MYTLSRLTDSKKQDQNGINSKLVGLEIIEIETNETIKLWSKFIQRSIITVFKDQKLSSKKLVGIEFYDQIIYLLI